MNTQIIITPAGVLWVAGAIVSISAAAGVLIWIYKHFRKPGGKPRTTASRNWSESP